MVLTSLTTTPGFLSFLASPITPIGSFGLFAAVGILFCLLWSLTVIPAALTLIPAQGMQRAPGREDNPDRDSGGAPRSRPPGLLVDRPRVFLAGLALLTLGLALGVPRLFVPDSWIDGFSSRSPFRVATDRVNQQLHGTHVLLVHLSFSGTPSSEELRALELSGTVGPLLDSDLLAAVGELEGFLEDRPEVGGLLGPCSHLTAGHVLWLARRQGARELPTDPRLIQRAPRRFDQARVIGRRREAIDDGLRRAVVTIFIKEAARRKSGSRSTPSAPPGWPVC